MAISPSPHGTPIIIPEHPSPAYETSRARDKETIAKANGDVDHLRSAGHNLASGLGSIAMTPFALLNVRGGFKSAVTMPMRLLQGGAKDVFFDAPIHAARAGAEAIFKK